jgi:hypothetical protein
MNEVAVLLGERCEHSLKINHSVFQFSVWYEPVNAIRIKANMFSGGRNENIS